MFQGRLFKGLAILAVLLASACAEPRLGKNLVIVLPDENGNVGAVTVTDGKNEVLLDSALAAAKITSGNRVEPVAVTNEDVDGIFARALAAQPRPPKRFRLYFIRDSDDLTEESEKEFELVFADVKKRSAYEVQVTGHTDTTGDESYNAQLSIKRAAAIRDRLVSRGIDSALIEVYGRGEWDLYIRTKDEFTEPRNRRVEVMIR
ncbi:MAG: OmpA family protein [Alphaproteobacteria bacterium]